MGDTFYDVCYDVWQRGGNPDLVDRDRVMDAAREGDYPEDIAESELRRQRRAQDRLNVGILPDDDEG